MSIIRRPWVAPLAGVTLLFLVFALPPYLGLDPDRARLPVPEGIQWYYPVLVVHIFLGAVALLTACMQVWPWLRRRRPRWHRLSGRAYVAAVVPAGVAATAIALFSTFGPNVRVPSVLLGVLWVVTALAGLRAARQRRFAEHREWMLRSFALSFVIVGNRVWVPLCVIVFAPGSVPGRSVPDPAAFAQAAGVAAWMGLFVNLLLVEWWLHHTRFRKSRAQRATPAVTEAMPAARAIRSAPAQ